MRQKTHAQELAIYFIHGRLPSRIIDVFSLDQGELVEEVLDEFSGTHVIQTDKYLDYLTAGDNREHWVRVNQIHMVDDMHVKSVYKNREAHDFMDE